MYGSAHAGLTEIWHPCQCWHIGSKAKEKFEVSQSQGMHSCRTCHFSVRHDPQWSTLAWCTGGSPEPESLGGTERYGPQEDLSSPLAGGELVARDRSHRIFFTSTRDMICIWLDCQGLQG